MKRKNIVRNQRNDGDKSAILITDSKELYDKLLTDYKGKIFGEQIYAGILPVRQKFYLISGLSLKMLRPLFSDNDENYEIYSRKKTFLVYGQENGIRWFAS